MQKLFQMRERERERERGGGEEAQMVATLTKQGKKSRERVREDGSYSSVVSIEREQMKRGYSFSMFAHLPPVEMMKDYTQIKRVKDAIK